MRSDGFLNPWGPAGWNPSRGFLRNMTVPTIWSCCPATSDSPSPRATASRRSSTRFATTWPWSPNAARCTARTADRSATASARTSTRASVAGRRDGRRYSAQPWSELREVGEKDASGVEPLHVGELHPDGTSVAEHVDVSLAPDERVHVHL